MKPSPRRNKSVDPPRRSVCRSREMHKVIWINGPEYYCPDHYILHVLQNIVDVHFGGPLLPEARVLQNPFNLGLDIHRVINRLES